LSVPEGDTIFRAAAQLHDALVGKELVELEVRRDPRGRRGPEPGTTITAVDAAGKHLLVHFDDGHVLHTHMQMTGAWQVYPTASTRWRRPAHTARVVLRVDDGTTAVCFGAPIVELRRERDERVTRATRMLDRLGPDLCAPEFDVEAVLTRLASVPDDTELGAVLLDQRVAAGIGNVYKSEICWAERVSPFARLGSLDDTTRRALYETARRQLTSNLGTGPRTTHGRGLAVYGRARRPCPRCRATIVSRRGPSNRATYWCPRCQPEPTRARDA
jgi:endonuclease-8